MSVPTGSAASNWTDEAPAEMPTDDRTAQSRPRSGYLRDLALRRDALAIRRQIVYGLAMGWVLTLVAGFMFCCVVSRLNWLWVTLIVVGLIHLAAAVILPQALY